MNRSPTVQAQVPPSYPDQSIRAELVFSRDPAGRTYLSRQFAPYPFHICRTLYVETDPPGMATLYVQSCSAGLLQRDDLHTSIVVEDGAQIHFTTAAQTIVHSMDEGEAKQEVRIEAFPGSLAEYLPEPLILFPQSRLRSVLQISAHEASAVIAGESFLLHDYSGADRVLDWFESELRIEQAGGVVVARDRFHLTGDLFKKSLPGVNGAFAAQGSLVVLDGGRPPETIVDAIRGSLASAAGIYAGVSALRDRSGAWTRLLALDGLTLRRGMFAAWSAAREVLTGLRATARRK
jgi:urease accessory protein